MAGDGLVRPLNAPPAASGGLGTQPGAQSAVVVASRVIVSGSFGLVTIIGGAVNLNAPGPGLSLQGGQILEFAPGSLSLQSGLAGAGDAVAELHLLSQSASGAGYPVALLANGTYIVPRSPVTGNPETWTAVTTPAGMTGTIRVKLLAEAKLAALDVDVTITSTSTAGTSYTAGALPSAAYYPAAARQFPLTVNQGMGASPTIPRVAVPTSGAVSLLMPGFTTAGLACIVSGTVIYPLD